MASVTPCSIHMPTGKSVISQERLVWYEARVANGRVSLARWKAGGTSDIREGLDKLPQKVASASDGTETPEDAEPKTPENGDVAPSAEVEGSEEASIEKDAEEKAPLSGGFTTFCALYIHPCAYSLCLHVHMCLVWVL